MNIFSERFLQFVCVVWYVLTSGIFAILIAVGFVYAALFTQYWWIVALYIAWRVYDRNSQYEGGYADNWYRRSHARFWEYFAAYFPMKFYKTADLSPEHNYIIGCHPHGLIASSYFINMCTEANGWSKLFPNIKTKLCTHDCMFWLPLRREQVLATGLISVAARSIEYVLKHESKGLAVGIVIGGAEEALDAHPNKYDLTLLNRKGFVKIALKNGAHLVPMFSFGETDVYDQLANSQGTWMRNFQEKIKKAIGFCVPLAYGRGIIFRNFGWFPYRRPINTVVGKPIPVIKTPNPTQKQIDELHAEYCSQLVKLFEENRTKFGVAKDVKLVLY